MNPIKKHRLEKEMSVDKVSQSLGVSRQIVYKWEKDLCMPTILNLVDLASVLDVDTKILLNELCERRKEICG